MVQNTIEQENTTSFSAEIHSKVQENKQNDELFVHSEAIYVV